MSTEAIRTSRGLARFCGRLDAGRKVAEWPTAVQSNAAYSQYILRFILCWSWGFASGSGRVLRYTKGRVGIKLAENENQNRSLIGRRTQTERGVFSISGIHVPVCMWAGRNREVSQDFFFLERNQNRALERGRLMHWLCATRPSHSTTAATTALIIRGTGSCFLYSLVGVHWCASLASYCGIYYVVFVCRSHSRVT